MASRLPMIAALLAAALVSGACASSRAASRGAAAAGAGGPPAPGTAARIAWLEQAVRKNPGDAEAWKQLGNDFYDTHQAQKAVEAYDRYLELEPGNPDVLCDQASMYRELGQLASAEKTLKRALERNPRHRNSLFNLGVVYAYDLQQPRKAIEAWETLLALGESEQAARARFLMQQLRSQEQ